MNIVMKNNGEVTMTLKEITDLLGVRHDKAMIKVLKLAEEPSFGEVSYLDIAYNDKGQIIKTLLLSEEQSTVVENILTFNKAKSLNKSNVIYLITDGEYTKIGIATGDATLRLKACQTGNPKKLWIDFEMFVNNAFDVEQELHKTYKDKRLEGEWFVLSEEEIKSIKNYIKGL